MEDELTTNQITLPQEISENTERIKSIQYENSRLLKTLREEFKCEADFMFFCRNEIQMDEDLIKKYLDMANSFDKTANELCGSGK